MYNTVAENSLNYWFNNNVCAPTHMTGWQVLSGFIQGSYTSCSKKKVWSHLFCARMALSVSVVGVGRLNTKGGRGVHCQTDCSAFTSLRPWSTHTASSFSFSCSPSLVRWHEIPLNMSAGRGMSINNNTFFSFQSKNYLTVEDFSFVLCVVIWLVSSCKGLLRVA